MARILRDKRRILSAIDEARRYAAENGVPMTIERIAACLGVDREKLLACIRGDDEEAPPGIVRTLRAAWDECAASLVEQGMTRGGNATMAMFALKCDHGYNDRPDREPSHVVVHFEGEDRL